MPSAKGNPCTSCEALIFSFAHHLDHHEFEQAISQFSENGIFERPDGTLNGHEEMQAFWSQRPSSHITRHLCHKPFFTQQGETEIKAITQATLYNAGKEDGASIAIVSAPLGIVEFQDTFMLINGAWKIAHRRAIPVLIYQSNT